MPVEIISLCAINRNRGKIMMTNDKIKNDMTMATMLVAGLKNKSEYIVTDKYEVEIVSDGINGDIDCSNTFN